MDCFLRPNQLLSGGVTGTALLIHEQVGFPVGLMVALFNVPIFALGVRVVGRRFAAYSALGVVFSWLLIDHAPLPALTNDPLLAGIFGGVFSGLATALALRSGGSLGGFDILGVVVNRRFSYGVGEVLMVLNGALIAAKGFLGTPELALYTLAGIYVSGRTLDGLLTVRPRKAFLIVSRAADRIRQRVLSQMRRGLTVLPAEGGYSAADTNVVLCVVTRPEMRELQEIVREEDRDAFVVVLEASAVVGYFREPSAFAYWRERRARSAGPAAALTGAPGAGAPQDPP